MKPTVQTTLAMRQAQQAVGWDAYVVAGALSFICAVHVNAQTPNWADYNRSIGLNATATQQRYRETDTQGLTADGTLNTERGTVGGWGVQGRWQGALGPVPLWAQANAHWAQGQTHYNGYLQSGNTLTPFQAKTGNTWHSQSLALGVPFALGHIGQFQLIPHLQWSSQRWQRNLVQYGETYRHRSAGLGLGLQWSVTERLTLEAMAARRWQSHAHVSVPAFGFAAQQGHGTETELSAVVRWQVNTHWYLQASASTTHFRNSASPTLQGMQAPPNTHHTVRYALGLAWHY